MSNSTSDGGEKEYIWKFNTRKASFLLRGQNRSVSGHNCALGFGRKNKGSCRRKRDVPAANLDPTL